MIVDYAPIHIYLENILFSEAEIVRVWDKTCALYINSLFKLVFNIAYGLQDGMNVNE